MNLNDMVPKEVVELIKRINGLEKVRKEIDKDLVWWGEK